MLMNEVAHFCVFTNEGKKRILMKIDRRVYFVRKKNDDGLFSYSYGRCSFSIR